MKKKKWLFLTVLILAMMLPGCGNTQQELRIEETEKEEKLQIGLSFDSFVIERWLRDRDMFVSTAQSLGAEVNVQVAGGIVEEQISQQRGVWPGSSPSATAHPHRCGTPSAS